MDHLFDHSTRLFNDKSFSKLIDYYYNNVTIIFENWKQSINIKTFNNHIFHLVYANKRMSITNKNNKYIIILCNNKLLNKLYALYMVQYFINSKQDKNLSYACIDFEFYKKDIALMQINFETPDEYNYIWLNDPKKFTQQQTNLFVNTILTNDKIYKILHGSESNDLPYLYNHILISNNNIINFTRRLIDTRYLCEYAKYNSEHKKCSLYDALLFFSTIDKDQYDYLESINKKMGPIQYIRWDIYNLQNTQINYALYDVLYLKDLLNDMYKYVTLNHPNLINSYKYIPSITRFVFLERLGTSNIVSSIKQTIDNYHTCTVKYNGKIIGINEIYDMCLNDIQKNLNIDIEYINSIGYVKKYFVYIIKYIIYGIKCGKKLNTDNLLGQLETARCKKIIKLINIIKEFIE